MRILWSGLIFFFGACKFDSEVAELQPSRTSPKLVKKIQESRHPSRNFESDSKPYELVDEIDLELSKSRKTALESYLELHERYLPDLEVSCAACECKFSWGGHQNDLSELISNSSWKPSTVSINHERNVGVARFRQQDCASTPEETEQ
jgi:hypothetical protein